jgi:predicted dinucleotide-binding enzyme
LAANGATSEEDVMRIGIIGAGKLGTALGAGRTRAGHEVLQGVRGPDVPARERLAASGRVTLDLVTGSGRVVRTD